MADQVIQVLTFKSIQTILATGGTQSWTLDKGRAKACKYAVCCRNAHTRHPEDLVPHGTAFVVGLISDVVPSTETEGRWLILFSKYAMVEVDDRWEGRNPVAYYTVDDYEGEIDFDALKWNPMPERTAQAAPAIKQSMTIAEAKAALAESFGVDPSAIEITIRG